MQQLLRSWIERRKSNGANSTLLLPQSFVPGTRYELPNHEKKTGTYTCILTYTRILMKVSCRRRQRGAPGRFSLVWLWCGGHIEVRSVPRVFTERTEVSLVTLNLCVMRRYNLGEGDLVSTIRTHRYVPALASCKAVKIYLVTVQENINSSAWKHIFNFGRRGRDGKRSRKLL